MSAWLWDMLARTTFPRWLWQGPRWWRSVNAWWLSWWGWAFYASKPWRPGSIDEVSR